MAVKRTGTVFKSSSKNPFFWLIFTFEKIGKPFYWLLLGLILLFFSIGKITESIFEEITKSGKKIKQKIRSLKIIKFKKRLETRKKLKVKPKKIKKIKVIKPSFNFKKWLIKKLKRIQLPSFKFKVKITKKWFSTH